MALQELKTCPPTPPTEHVYRQPTNLMAPNLADIAKGGHIFSICLNKHVKKPCFNFLYFCVSCFLYLAMSNCCTEMLVYMVDPKAYKHMHTLIVVHVFGMHNLPCAGQNTSNRLFSLVIVLLVSLNA